MALFAPRYKHYAAWPVVIWCRLIRQHKDTGRFWSGGRGRCINCGDYVDAMTSTRLERIVVLTLTLASVLVIVAILLASCQLPIR